MAHKIMAVCIVAIVVLVLGAPKASAIKDCRSQDELVRGASVVWDNLHLESNTADAEVILSQITHLWYVGKALSECQRQIVEALYNFAQEDDCFGSYYVNTCNVEKIMDTFVEPAEKAMKIYFRDYAQRRGKRCEEIATRKFIDERLNNYEVKQVEFFFRDVLTLRPEDSYSKLYNNLDKFLDSRWQRNIGSGERQELRRHCKTLFESTYAYIHVVSLRDAGNLEMLEERLPDDVLKSFCKMHRICDRIEGRIRFKWTAESSRRP